LLDKRQISIDSEQENINKKNSEIDAAREEVERLVNEQQEQLEKVAGLSADEAKKGLLESVEKQYATDLENRMRKLEIASNEKLEQRANEILTTAVHRLGNSV